MSERSCKNCVKGSAIGLPEVTMSRMPCLWMHRDGLAAICKHYEEREEPTAFDKAWREHGKNPCEDASYEGLFRAGWQAALVASYRFNKDAIAELSAEPK